MSCSPWAVPTSSCIEERLSKGKARAIQVQKKTIRNKSYKYLKDFTMSKKPRKPTTSAVARGNTRGTTRGVTITRGPSRFLFVRVRLSVRRRLPRRREAGSARVRRVHARMGQQLRRRRDLQGRPVRAAPIRIISLASAARASSAERRPLSPDGRTDRRSSFFKVKF